MSDYMTHLLEVESRPSEPTSIWEVCFECDVSAEGDVMDDSLDVTAGNDGAVAVEKTRRFVLSREYLEEDAEFHPTVFVLKGLRLLATGIL